MKLPKKWSKTKTFKNKTNPRYTKEYDEWRKKVLKRDHYKCQMPGCTTPRKQIQVHHIIRYADSHYLRFSPANGICLCRKHHDSIKDKEPYYISLFVSIVQKNETK